jgi:hypothetical protein
VALEAGADQLQGHYFASPAVGLGHESFGSSILVRLGRMRATGVAAAS